MRKQYFRSSAKFLWEMIESFLKWVKMRGYFSYDQYDFWSTAYGQFAKNVYHKKNYIGIPLIFPIFILELFFPYTRIIMIQKKRFPIADAHFILAYINLFNLKKNGEFLDEAIKISDELLKTSIPGYSGYCWGYPFNWQTSRRLAPKETPLITTVPYCFEAFLSLYDTTNDQKYLNVAHSIAQFVSKDIRETPVSKMSSACSYSPLDSSKVINASAYRANVLMEAYNRFERNEFKEKAIKNINFVLENQQLDGSWLYAVENPHNSFIDNFHTCLVLKNLYKSNIYLRSNEIHDAIKKGYNFYRANLFAQSDVPKPFAVLNRMQLVKIETYDYAEGISLGVLLKNEIPGAFKLAKKLAEDVYTNFQLSDGHFVSRIYKGGIRNTVPYIRWPQAQMFFALTLLLNSMQND